MKSEGEGEVSSQLPPLPKIEYPDEAFHMVTQAQWEEDIIWNGEEVSAGERCDHLIGMAIVVACGE